MKPERRELTDAYIRSLSKQKPAATLVICDTLSPLRVKVRPSGAVSYFVWARFGGAVTSASSRTIGRVDAIKLADARETAREWTKLARAKDDPARIERERREREAADRALTFDGVLTEYAKLRLSEQRRGRMVERELRRNFLPGWKGKPLKALTRGEIIRRLEQIKAASGPYEARNAGSGLRTMLNWAAERYELENVPTDRMKLSRVVGETPPRQRVLTEDELFAFWRAAERTPYPAGPIYQMLLLTAGRLNEIVGLRWREVKLNRGLITIPAERFKQKTDHRIPISSAAREVLEGVPRWVGGDAVFSRSGGELPTRIGDPDKQALNRRMLRTLKALARLRGEDPAQVAMAPWVNHDLRRTVRTQLSALRISDNIIELILGHAKQGLQRVYDQHNYEQEMREALEAWARRLDNITQIQLSFSSPNVVIAGSFSEKKKA